MCISNMKLKFLGGVDTFLMNSRIFQIFFILKIFKIDLFLSGSMWELIPLNILPILIVAYATIQTPVTIKSKSDFPSKRKIKIRFYGVNQESSGRPHMVKARKVERAHEHNTKIRVTSLNNVKCRSICTSTEWQL